MTALMLGPVHGFMLWNLYLALIPAVLAFVLFRRPARLGIGWCAGFSAWLLFLPNAPYVLTDVVHLVDDMHSTTSHGRAYEFLAIYAVYVAAGLVSYVVSLQLFRRFLHRVSPRRAVLPIMLVVHGLCVVAMYVGRFMRFNSWDAILAPRTVLASVVVVPRTNTLVILAVMFVVVGVSAYVTAAVGDKALAELRRLTTR